MIDVRLESSQGQIKAFALNLRTLLDDEWIEVVRYDTDHGHLHVHKFWVPEEKRITTLDPRKRSDYNDCLKRAEMDLKQNWKEYKKRIRERMS